MPAINSSAPPRNLSSAPSGISTKSPIGGTLNNTYTPASLKVSLPSKSAIQIGKIAILSSYSSVETTYSVTSTPVDHY